MKKKALAIILMCFVLLGCPMGGGDYGSMILTFSTSEMGAKLILPPLDMDIDYYHVTGDGPDPATFFQSVAAGSSVVENSLLAGAWLFTVDAFNADDYLIGSGSTPVAIIAGQTAQAEVVVAPLEGTGALDISISWPPGAIADPVISGTLTDSDGTPQSIPFSVGAESASYSYTSLDVGYYALTIQIFDGIVDKGGVPESVRILKDQLTEAIFDLTAEDLNTG